jgi:uncharacterized membrane protein YdjX (TVP38/TMEM64 family)
MSPGIFGVLMAAAAAGHLRPVRLIVIVLIVVALVAIVKAVRRRWKAVTADSRRSTPPEDRV